MFRLIIRAVPHMNGEGSVDMTPEGNPAMGTTQIFASLAEAQRVALSTYTAVADCGMPVELIGVYHKPARRN